jgi:hypothetical protein
MDRRRFLLRGLTGAAGAAVILTTGPEFLAPAGATPTIPLSTALAAKAPNLVFDPTFEWDTVGSSPRGWIIS